MIFKKRFSSAEFKEWRLIWIFYSALGFGSFQNEDSSTKINRQSNFSFLKVGTV
ncbi:hypothetical protein LSS_17560 [Leptospira santarosai serovar Shermani str. LT 821]|uniref:Uncharacterized protein n=1 Tax=Leptospira santarosai serovar Shermani str. LT 821 TaxID=758847 RepID=K8Y6M8_9LEPT|nr:hypothetical protein LSS_17560 [Leptospira santarosai serovar Shermani str. LT 821]